MTEDQARYGALAKAAGAGLLRRFTMFAVLIAPLLTGSAIASGESFDGGRIASQTVAQAGSVSIDELKRLYLSCSEEALSGTLSFEEILRCSAVYEELKQRAFGGDYDKFRAWSSTQPAEPRRSAPKGPAA
jgi:hypothetical protein